MTEPKLKCKPGGYDYHMHEDLQVKHYVFTKPIDGITDSWLCAVCHMSYDSITAAQNCHPPCKNCGTKQCKKCSTCGIRSCVGCQCCQTCYHKSTECICCSDCGNPCVCCCNCNSICPGCSKSGFTGICNHCDYTGLHVDPVRRAALEHGLNFRRNLAQDAADYYLLMNMWQIHKMGKAYLHLLKMSEVLAPEFATYLDMACGGELRYMDRPGECKIIPALEEKYPEFNSNDYDWKNDRGLQWSNWTTVSTPERRAQFAVDAFYYGFRKVFTYGVDMYEKDPNILDCPWDGSIGGRRWGDIASVLLLYVTRQINHIAFLDRVWNLQHNGGCALNKVYSVTQDFTKILAAHGNDDVNRLYRHASKEVRALWRECDKWITRVYVGNKPDKQLKLQTDALVARRIHTELKTLGVNNLRELVAAADREQEEERERLIADAEKKMNFAMSRVTKPETMARYIHNYQRDMYVAHTLGTGDYTPPLNSIINIGIE